LCSFNPIFDFIFYLPILVFGRQIFVRRPYGTNSRHPSRGAVLGETLTVDLTATFTAPDKFFGTVSPFGMAANPTVTAEIVFDPSLNGFNSLVSVNYVTGSKTWTLADAESPFSGVFGFVSQSNFGEIGLTFDGSNVIVLTVVQSQAFIADADNGIVCNRCVTASFVETSETPLPAALPLFATGLGALGLLGWRRKRKAAVGS
jgi:hypothetical protein